MLLALCRRSARALCRMYSNRRTVRIAVAIIRPDVPHMRSILHRGIVAIAAGVLGAGSALAADEPRVINVFLLAGQSNMAGADSEVDETTGFQQTEADRATRFTCAPLPQGDQSSDYVAWGNIHGHHVKNRLVHGPEVGFARALHAAGWRDVALIKVYANFSRDVPSWPWAEGGALFSAWTSFVDARIAELAAEGHQVRVQGFVWHQGIDDAIHGELATHYEDNLRALIAALRARYGTAETPFVLARSVHSRIAQPQPDPNETSAMAQVRRAQVRIGQSVPYAAWINVDDLPNVNTHHFTAAGQLVIGERFAQAMERGAKDEKRE